MAVDLARQFFNKRDYITKQYPKKHKLSGSVPRNKKESFECRLALAEYYLSMDRLSVAEHHLRKAVKSHPKSTNLSEAVAKVHTLIQNGEYEDAKKHAQEVIDNIFLTRK